MRAMLVAKCSKWRERVRRHAFVSVVCKTPTIVEIPRIRTSQALAGTRRDVDGQSLM
jgi:hypothetical protein